MWNVFLRFICNPFFTVSTINYDDFYQAIAEGDLEAIENFLNDGADTEAYSDSTEKYTALAHAVIHDQLPAINLLLEKGANIDAKTKWGNSLLSLAAYCNKPGLILFFSEQGLGIEFKGRRGNTPLIVASSKGNIEAVNTLLTLGANINATNEFQESALLLAAKYNQWEMVRFLVEHGANIETPDQDGNTAFLTACEYGNTDIVAYLVNAGANCQVYNNAGQNARDLAKLNKQADTFIFLYYQHKISLQSRLEALNFAGKIPDHLLCPVSLEIMDDPVTLSNGQTYDRRSLIRCSFFAKNGFYCPLTKDPIADNEALFKTNIHLKNLAEEFVESLEKNIKNQAVEMNKKIIIREETDVIQEEKYESVHNHHRLFSNNNDSQIGIKDDPGLNDNIHEKTPLL